MTGPRPPELTSSAEEETPAAPDQPLRAGEPLRDRHVPALDGLRALFVIAVIAYHLGYPWARGGFLGVDAFFALSGYLITRLLIEEHERSRRLDVARFWLRRIRRLLPALLVMLVAVALASVLWTDATQYGALRGDALSGLAYVANWRFIVSGQSYFDLFSAPSPLKHLWSLAIEEQFYLVWPLVLLVCFRLGGAGDDGERRGRRITFAVCVAGIAASAALMAHWYVAGDPSRVYYGTETRAQTILVGCLLALLLTAPRPRPEKLRVPSIVGVFAAIAILSAFVFVGDTDARIYRGGSLVFAVLVACVLWYVTTRPSAIERALSVTPLVFLGRISYGLYLWHWPVIVFMTPANARFDGWPLDVARLAATFTLAVLSYRLVELPIRRNTTRVATVWAIAGIAAVAVLFVAVTADAKPVPNFLGGHADPNGRCAEESPAALQNARAFYATLANRATPDIRLRGKRILVVGDSTACSLVVGLEAVGDAYGVTIGNGTAVGCGVVSERLAGALSTLTRTCAKQAQQAEAGAFTELHPDIVVWTSSWERYSLTKGGRTLVAGTRAWTSELNARITAAVRRFEAGGARVVLLTQPPDAPGPSIFGSHPYVVPSRADDAAFLRYNALLRDFAAHHARDVTLVDLAGRVCPGGPPCGAALDGMIARYDGVHYRTTAAVIVADWLYPHLAR